MQAMSLAFEQDKRLSGAHLGLRCLQWSILEAHPDVVRDIREDGFKIANGQHHRFPTMTW